MSTEFKISNVEILGIDETVKASGFPKRLDDKDDFSLDRMDKLTKCKNGTGHDSAAKGIILNFNITAPQYFWLQWDRYDFSQDNETGFSDDYNRDIISSQSKTHKIQDMDIEEQCNFQVDPRMISIVEEKLELFNKDLISIDELLSNVPMGLMLTARVTSSYLQEKTIYTQRRNHKSNIWQMYCDWLETLPHSHWITGNPQD